MKKKVDPVEFILAIFILLFMFFCMIVIRDAEQLKQGGRPINDPNCSAWDLSIIEEIRCGKQV